MVDVRLMSTVANVSEYKKCGKKKRSISFLNEVLLFSFHTDIAYTQQQVIWLISKITIKKNVKKTLWFQYCETYMQTEVMNFSLC